MRKGRAGFSIAELLTAVAILGMITVAGGIAWQKTAARTRATSAARMLKLYLHQARMKAIHHGVNHFVVLDRSKGTVEIYEDTGTTVGSFDDDDPRIASGMIDGHAQLGLPSGISLTSPLDATAVSDPWSLPDPDSSARWGSDLLGLMCTPTGLIESAEATPSPVTSGIAVFSTGTVTTAVGVRGLEGSVRTYEFFQGAWREI